MSRPKPTLHADFPMETRVRISEDILPEASAGTIVGVASQNIFYIYIILLDQPIELDGELHRGITVPGTGLKLESAQHGNLTLDDIASFTWDFGARFLLETYKGYKGNFIWSDPEYGGDNTIKPCDGDSEDFRGGKYKGKHPIRAFCGENVRIYQRSRDRNEGHPDLGPLAPDDPQNILAEFEE